MAVSESTTSNQIEWVQFYSQMHQTSTTPNLQSSLAESTTVVTTTASPTTSTINSGVSTNLNCDRRSGKPGRRRSRASRKAPTTLLNTDTTNFRAMVQQYTGITSAQPYPTVYHQSMVERPNYNYGFQQPHLPNYQHQHQHHMFVPTTSFNNNTNNNIQERATMDMSSSGFLMDGMSSSSQVIMSRPSSTAARTTTDGFLL